MDPEEQAVTTEIAGVILALNRALEKARALDMEVKLDYCTIEVIGKRLPMRAYYAEISKQAFARRVG